MTLAPLQQQIISLCRWVLSRYAQRSASRLSPSPQYNLEHTSNIGHLRFLVLPFATVCYRNEFRHTCLHRAVPAQQFRCNFASSGMNHGPSIAKNAVRSQDGNGSNVPARSNTQQSVLQRNGIFQKAKEIETITSLMASRKASLSSSSIPSLSLNDASSNALPAKKHNLMKDIALHSDCTQRPA